MPILALAADLGPSGDTEHRLSASIVEEFNHFTLVQQARGPRVTSRRER